MPIETLATLTEERIRHILSDDILIVERHGVRYAVTWDDEGAAVCAWRDGCDEGTPAECQFGCDEEEAAPEILRWLRGQVPHVAPTGASHG